MAKVIVNKCAYCGSPISEHEASNDIFNDTKNRLAVQARTFPNREPTGFVADDTIILYEQVCKTCKKHVS